MKKHTSNPDRLLDEAVAAMAAETPSPEMEARAAERAWERIAEEAAGLGQAAAPAADEASTPLESCEDFQAEMPAYVAGELPEGRALLVADHSRECVPCRRALKEARKAASAPAASPLQAPGAARRTARTASAARPAASTWQVWGRLAAVLVLVIGAAFGGYYVYDYFDTTPNIAQVASVDGNLFRVAATETRPLAVGASFAEGDVIRTGMGSGAVFRLGDGSLVEMRERSEIAVGDRMGETTIRVDRGSVIVEAAKQHGKLYVATEDCLVAVTGTIFSVNHGVKGSRVSVIEGEVRVAQNRREMVLHPGDQVVTHAGLARTSVADEVAWSRNHGEYIALLREFKVLSDEWNEALAATGLRYDSRLVNLVPANTGIYAALPNLSEELVEMREIFNQRLAENPALARWWAERMGNSGMEENLNDALTRLRSLGQYLGEEVVVAMAIEGEGEPQPPVILAEVINPSAFAAVLEEEVARINAEAEGQPLVILDNPADASGLAEDGLYLWPAGDLFVASPEPRRIAEVAAVLAGSGQSGFVGTSFHTQLTEAYGQGAQWLAGVRMGDILSAGPQGEDDAEALAFSGFDSVDTLLIERKSEGNSVHTGAVLSFDGPRHGMVSWLAAPAPMGSLDYISAEANFTAAFVVTEPASILEQTFAFVEANDPDFRAELDRFEQEAGIRLIDDLAAPLGGEMAVALDGPALPKPAWKVVAEVYDAGAFVSAVEWAVEKAGRIAEEEGAKVRLTLTETRAGGRTFYRLGGEGKLFEVYFTFDGGYLVAAPTQALVEKALSVKASGYGLTDSETFTALLPRDGYVNFSALLYSNLGSLSRSLLSAAEGSGALTEEQRDAIRELDLGTPSLTCAYGEDDRIRIVSNGQGGLLGSRLGGLLGLGILAGHPGGDGAHGLPGFDFDAEQLEHGAGHHSGDEPGAESAGGPTA